MEVVTYSLKDSVGLNVSGLEINLTLKVKKVPVSR